MTRIETYVTAVTIDKSVVWIFFDRKFVKKDSYYANCYKLIFYITTA